MDKKKLAITITLFTLFSLWLIQSGNLANFLSFKVVSASPDPVITDTFDDESKIASKTNLAVSGGQVKLAISGQTCVQYDSCGNTPSQDGIYCTCYCQSPCSGSCGCMWTEEYQWCGQSSCVEFCTYCGCLYCTQYVDAYYTSGNLISNNLLSGQTVTTIDSFSYTASLIPSGASLKVQFSQDNASWYNSSGDLGQWDTCSLGTHSIDLSGLGWSGPNFYYKMEFTSDGSNTPALDEVSVHFTNVFLPVAVTTAAILTTEVSAILNGQISDDGGEPCQYRFRYKKSGGDYVYTAWAGAKTTGQTFYEEITGLDAGSLYYFNAQAKNSAGESAWGVELQFTAAVVCQNHNVWGWVWSENIGWISFSCTNTMTVGTGIDFGVDIDEGSGLFSGYAWSENVGWVDFAPEGPYPDVPDYSAKVDLVSGQVSGWARALSYGDGWDGWIKMSGGNYGVFVNFVDDEFSGFAWSDMVMGWESFNCTDEGVCGSSDYKVITSVVPPPRISNLINTFSPCSQSRIPNFFWETDADLPYDYEIKICSNSECSGPGDPLISNLVGGTSSLSWTPACNRCCNDLPYGNIDFGGGTYYVQIRARNTDGQWSDWTSSSFMTYDHCYPYADFLCDGADCTQMGISEDVVVTLSDNSTLYDGPLACSWTLPDITQVVEGNPASDCTIKVSFSAPPPGQREQDIELAVTDSSNYSCSQTKTIQVYFPLPEYREVLPIVWFKNLFTRIASVFTGF